MSDPSNESVASAMLDAGRMGSRPAVDAALRGDPDGSAVSIAAQALPDASTVRPDAGTGRTKLRDDELTCYPLRAHGGDFVAPYALGVAKDAYTAFTFAAPWREPAYAVLMRPVLDNERVVHHFLLFQDNEPGTPGPGVVELGAHPNAQLISAWVPGTDPLDFRHGDIDLGLELPADTTYTLEIHYNSTDAAAVDSSGVEVCAYPRKPQVIGSYTWVGTENLSFPAEKWNGVCKPDSRVPIHIVAITPHMHLTGRHMKVSIKRANGALETVHDAAFDFAYERQYVVNVRLDPGDSLLTECTYSEPKSYGPRVEDEMCYLFTMAYPKGALSSPDLFGAVLHGSGTTCLGQ